MKVKNGIYIVLALAVAGCGSGGTTYEPKPPKPVETTAASTDASEYFPFKVGNQWVYQLESQRVSQGQRMVGSGEVTFKCVSATPVDGGGTKAVIEVVTDNKVTERQTWMSNAKGVYQMTVGPKETPFVPPQPSVLVPADKDRVFTWEGTGMIPSGQSGTSKVVSKILGPQEVDTAMGAMTGIAIESQTTLVIAGKKSLSISTTWWKPGTGVIRYKSVSTDSLQVLKLKSFIPK